MQIASSRFTLFAMAEGELLVMTEGASFSLSCFKKFCGTLENASS